MAIVIRIVSADGKRTMMKSLPGLPARLKVPAGAKVEVTEDGRTMSLAQYVNEHANRKDPDHILDTAKVVVEPAENWEEASTWLDSLAAPSNSPDNSWFSTAEDAREPSVAGVDVDGLLIGTGLAAGAAFGIYEVTRSNKPKDTVSPVAPAGLNLAAEDDNGLSTTDKITSKTTGLTILGNAEAGATVELFDGTTSLGTAVANNLGIWTKDVDLAQGEHSITAKAKDNAGNVSNASSAVKVVVDTTAPVAATGLDLAADDDTGASSTDNITSKTTGLTITGTAEAGAQVELFDGTTSLGKVTAGTGGTFSLDVALAVGTHTVTAKVTDQAGNAAPTSEALTITVDAAAGFALDLATADDTGSINNDNITNKTSGLTITGTITPNATIELFDGATSLGTTTTDATGAFSKDISLITGTHAITAKVSGTGGVSDVLTIVVDAVAPAAPVSLDLIAADDTGVSDSDNITSKLNNFTITGTAEANSTVELFNGNTSLGFVTANSNGIFTKLVTQIPAGTHTITARASDLAGNVSSASNALIVTFDPDAPAAPTSLDLASEDDNGSSNTDNITSNTSDLTISGNAEANSTIELFDGSTSLGTVTVGSNGVFSKDIALGVGTHSITAKATDAAGNVGAASSALSITVQSSPLSESLVADDHSAALSATMSTSELDYLTNHDTSGGTFA